MYDDDEHERATSRGTWAIRIGVALIVAVLILLAVLTWAPWPIGPKP